MFGGAILASGLGLLVAFAIVGIPAVIAGLSMFLKGRLAPQPVITRHRGLQTGSTPQRSLCSIKAVSRRECRATSMVPGKSQGFNQKMEEDHEASRHHRCDHRIGPAQEG